MASEPDTESEKTSPDHSDSEPEMTQTEETEEVVKPEKPDGLRVAICAVLFLAGVGCVIGGFLAGDETLKIIVCVGGIALMLVAFFGAMGAKGFKVEASRGHFTIDGEMPVGHVKKTKVTKLSVSKSLVEGQAPPKQGIMPPKQGIMPPKTGPMPTEQSSGEQQTPEKTPDEDVDVYGSVD